MSEHRPLPPRVVPTLTEIIQWPRPARVDSTADADEHESRGDSTADATAPQPDLAAVELEAAPTAASPAAETASTQPTLASAQAEEKPRVDASPMVSALRFSPSEQPATPASPASPLADDQLARRIVADLQRHVDLMLDVRLREALAPVLARAADAIVRDARQQLAQTLRDVVDQAIASERARP